MVRGFGWLVCLLFALSLLLLFVGLLCWLFLGGSVWCFVVDGLLDVCFAIAWIAYFMIVAVFLCLVADFWFWIWFDCYFVGAVAVVLR